MNIIIIEDELPARAKLEQMLIKLQPDITIAAQLGSVQESLRWLSQNPSPDLAFVDIQLSDNHSFEIFRKHPVQFPVVFTTAYDKYLLESFEYNSIDYLLKPITEENLRRSLLKVKKLEQHFIQGHLLSLIQEAKHTPPRNRIVARKGTDFVTLQAEEVAYFYTEHKIVFVKDFQGRNLIVDHNLAELEEMVDPKNFFRLNRKFLANVKAIEKFKPDSGKIVIHLTPEVREPVHVSKETAPAFRKWIGVVN